MRDRLDRWFEIADRGSTYRRELIGGATTFLTLVYIVFVNPAIVSSTPDLNGTRLPFDQVLAVTALAGGVLTVMMGVWGRYPFALAAGLGLNAYAVAEVAGFVVQGGNLATLAPHLGTWKMLVFILTLLVTWTLYQRGVQGALLIGVVGATVLATVINGLDHYRLWTDGTARLPRGSWLTTPDLTLADGSHFSFRFGVLGAGVIAVILAVVMSDLSTTSRRL